MPITKGELRGLLARDRADRVIAEIMSFTATLNDRYYQDQILLLSAKISAIKQAYFHGRMLETEFHEEKDAINGALLALIEELPLDEGQTTRKTTFLTTIPPQLPERIFPRPHLMNSIREAFQQKPFVLLHGPSGIGKTRLAEMFFHDYLQKYDYVGWFKVDTGFVQAFYLQANLINIPAIGEAFHTYKNVYQQPDHEVDAACARAFSNYIEQECTGQKLLVVDGITNFEKMLEPHLDLLRLTNTHVLICSHTLPSDSLRVRDAFPYTAVMADPFTEAELREMMLFYHLDPRWATATSHPVLSNPLLAGVFLKNCPADHPEQIRQLIAHLEKVASGEDYNHRLLTALFRWFDLAPAMKWVMLQYAAMPDIPREPDLVARLLQLKSVSAPVYSNGYNIFKGKYRHDEDPVVHFDQILDWLSARGWLVVDENGEHYLHRAFVPVLREQCKPKFDYFLEMAENLELKFFLDENDWEEDDLEVDNSHLKRLSEDDYEKHLGALFGLIQEEGSDNYLGLLYKYADLLHARLEWDKEISLREKAVTIIGKKEGEESKRFLKALDNLGMLFYETGAYQKALDCLLKEMLIEEKLLSTLDLNLATSFNNVGVTYGALGDHKRALEYEEKALEIRERVLPPLHPDLATSFNNVGATYGALGNHKRALEYGEKALEIREQVLPPRHPDLAKSFNNVGGTYGALGDHKKALEYAEKALEIGEQALPPRHPDLAASYDNVGSTYGALGDHKKALEYAEKALEIMEYALPPLHPDLAKSYNNVGKIYGALEDHKRALEYLEKALEIGEQVLPPLHPDLATSYNNIGVIYGDVGDRKRALEYKVKALSIIKQVLPPLHPSLAVSYNNIGVAYGALGDHKRALEYEVMALSIMEQALPPLHPDLAVSYNNIGGRYGEMGDRKRALEYEVKALSIREQVLAPLHPDLATSFNNVGSTYGALGNHKCALEYLGKALEIWEQVLPPLHPDLAKSYNNIGVTYGKMNDHKRALDYKKKALDIWKQVLPPLHPDLAKSYDNVGITYAKLRLFPEAKTAFEEYQKITPDGRAFRNWSMYHALQNHTAEALENLQRAVDNGYDDIEWITTDDSLDSIRNEPAYHRIVEQLRQKKEAEG